MRDIGLAAAGIGCKRGSAPHMTRESRDELGRAHAERADPPGTPNHLPKKLHIKTYGCQMNVYDSERMAGLLARHGYTHVPEAAAADLVVLNTCHIREKAAEKVYSELGRLRVMRDERRAAGAGDLCLVVAGCVAQAEGAAMLERAPFVDIVIGPQT